MILYREHMKVSHNMMVTHVSFIRSNSGKIDAQAEKDDIPSLISIVWRLLDMELLWGEYEHY